MKRNHIQVSNEVIQCIIKFIGIEFCPTAYCYLFLRDAIFQGFRWLKVKVNAMCNLITGKNETWLLCCQLCMLSANWYL